MPLRFLRFYKTALLLSLTAAIVIIALNVVRDPIVIALIVIGSLLGTFIMDLDYVLHAYFIEPTDTNSGLIKDYLYHRDLNGLAEFIRSHKDEIRNKTLHSALFQIILGLATIFVLNSSSGVLLKTLILSAFLNSIYRFIEEYLRNEAGDWFWSLKINTSPQNIYVFILVLAATLLYSFYIF
jgi:hypothetical protein